MDAIPFPTNDVRVFGTDRTNQMTTLKVAHNERAEFVIVK